MTAVVIGPPNVVVSTPYREASVQHIAGALKGAGHLRSFYVPLHTERGGKFGRKRRFDPQGRSLMPIHEVALTAAYHLGGRTAWPLLTRARTLDKRVAQRISAGPPILFVGMPYASVSSFSAVHKAGGVAVLNHVNADLRTENEVFATEEANGEAWSDGFVTRVLRELSLADYILVPSDYVRDDLVSRGVPESKVVVIPYGVDIDRFRPRATPSQATFSILYVGQVGHRKGLPYLLEALRILSGRGSRLTVAGPMTKGGLDLTSDELVKYVGCVDQSQLAAEYSRADVFVLPSLAEGMALVVLEAMSAGLPVIVTPATGYSGIVRDGVEGFVVPTRDAQAIADRLTTLARDPELRLAMGRAARARAEQYTWRAFEQKVVSELERSFPNQNTR